MLPALFWKNTQLPQTLFHGKSRISDSIHLLCACSSTKHSSGYWRTFDYIKDDQSPAQVAQAAAAQPSEHRELGVHSCCRMGCLTGDSLLGGASLLLLWEAATRAHTNLEASCRKAIAFGGNTCPSTEAGQSQQGQLNTRAACCFDTIPLVQLPATRCTKKQHTGQRKKPNIQKNVVFSSCQGSKQQLKLFSPRKPAGLHRIVIFVSLFEIPNHYFQLNRIQNRCRNSPYTSNTWQFPPYLLCSSLPQSHKTSNRNTWTTAW